MALLASMVAIGAVARLIPSFLGASPIFLLVILGGYVFGPAFGFQLGALTLAVSAFLTGGIGPWVPYQMLGVGWVGMFAGLLPKPAQRGPAARDPRRLRGDQRGDLRRAAQPLVLALRARRAVATSRRGCHGRPI